MIGWREGSMVFSCDECGFITNPNRTGLAAAYLALRLLGWRIVDNRPKDPIKHLCPLCKQKVKDK